MNRIVAYDVKNSQKIDNFFLDDRLTPCLDRQPGILHGDLDGFVCQSSATLRTGLSFQVPHSSSSSSSFQSPDPEVLRDFFFLWRRNFWDCSTLARQRSSLHSSV